MNCGGFLWCGNRWSVSSLSMYHARTIFLTKNNEKATDECKKTLQTMIDKYQSIGLNNISNFAFRKTSFRDLQVYNQVRTAWKLSIFEFLNKTIVLIKYFQRIACDAKWMDAFHRNISFLSIRSSHIVFQQKKFKNILAKNKNLFSLTKSFTQITRKYTENI